MEGVRRTALRNSTFRTGMLAPFVVLALLLGAIGIYGVIHQHQSASGDRVYLSEPTLRATATSSKRFRF